MLTLEKSTAMVGKRFVPFADATLSIASAPVLYGLSVYTVFGVAWNPQQKTRYAFRLRDHYERLLNSAKIMDFHDFSNQWPFTDFQNAMVKLIQENDIREDALVRVSVFIDEVASGTKIHGLKNGISAYVYPAGQLLPSTGAHVCISSWQRTPDNAIPSRAKVNGSYINASLMKNEAILNGYDDAIALDEHGHVAESTVANIFIVRHGKLVTPHAATDILEGITRDSVLKLADDLGIKHEQRAIDRSELYLADEVFLCGSSAIINPVVSVDHRQIGNGRKGSLTNKLATAYDQARRGENPKHKSWLTTIA